MERVWMTKEELKKILPDSRVELQDPASIRMLQFATPRAFDANGQEIETPRCKYCEGEMLQCIGREAYCWICPDCIQPKDEE
jgi:hypothetical protein